MSTVEPSLAGPKRPQDRLSLADVRASFHKALADYAGAKPRPSASGSEGGVAVATKQETAVTDGSVVIAAITSCTNTSNPSVMLGAGLLAKKAAEKGLDGAGLRQDELGTGLAGRHRLLGSGRRAALFGAARLPRRRLRLHDVHRQQRRAAG